MGSKSKAKSASSASIVAHAPDDASPQLRGRPLSAQELRDLMVELNSTVEIVNGQQVKYVMLSNRSPVRSGAVTRFARAVGRPLAS